MQVELLAPSIYVKRLFIVNHWRIVSSECIIFFIQLQDNYRVDVLNNMYYQPWPQWPMSGIYFSWLQNDFLKKYRVHGAMLFNFLGIYGCVWNRKAEKVSRRILLSIWYSLLAPDKIFWQMEQLHKWEKLLTYQFPPPWYRVDKIWVNRLVVPGLKFSHKGLGKVREHRWSKSQIFEIVCRWQDILH